MSHVSRILKSVRIITFGRLPLSSFVTLQLGDYDLRFVPSAQQQSACKRPSSADYIFRSEIVGVVETFAKRQS